MPGKLRNCRGMTLVEVLVAAAICSILLMLAGTMVIMLFTLVDNQSGIVAANQQGMKIVDDVGRLLDAAVLPIYVKPPAESGKSAWEDVDSPDVGFGDKDASGNGAGGRWRQALIVGVDNLAFAQVVKVLDSTADNRYDKDDPDRQSGVSRILLGQVRGGRGYLGAGIQPWINSLGKYRFDFREAGEPVNILARLDPDKFNSPPFERIPLPGNDDWRSATLASYNHWPNRTAFMAIRYIPVLNPGTNSPWIVSEANGFRGGRIDLDGDGGFTGSFHIGRLQLLYSGGTDLYTENAAQTELVSESLDQLAVDLSRDVVLRRADEAERTPIFQLDDPAPASWEEDDRGSYLRIRLLLVDNTGVGSDGLRASPYVKTLAPRWCESGVFMNNMRR